MDAAKAAAESAIDAFNRVWHPYRYEATLILLTNAWELLAKAVLVQQRESIVKGQRGDTITAETAVHRLQLRKLLDETQVATIQQVVSLRHAATHHLLPEVPPEVMQHLLYFASKFFRYVVGKVFPAHLRTMNEDYLSLSFSDLTTYADKVQKSVSRVKKSAGHKRLVWLLERGIQFDGSQYITEAQFEQKYKGKKRVLPHLALSRFIRGAEMVRIVPIQAPRNFTADISLRKGSAADASLPVLVKRTEIESDYPYLTRELGQKLGKNQNWVARAATVLGLKGVPTFHQAVRASTTSTIQRYSEAALQKLQQKLATSPDFDPYHAPPVPQARPA
ncbi:MAG: hypothetical protein HY700_16875 [Gemmatimonadetes bacterium]|nr:hypothetical protein [Gemmatimonadota bacterium]